MFIRLVVAGGVLSAVAQEFRTWPNPYVFWASLLLALCAACFWAAEIEERDDNPVS